jgi:hypothetical protein
MTPADRKRLREMAEAATPGPWTQVDSPRLRGAIDAEIDGHKREVASASGQAPQFDLRADAATIQHANAEFIAAARTAIPALLDALDAAERERDAKQRGFEDLHEMVPGASDIWTKVDAVLKRIAALEKAVAWAKALRTFRLAHGHVEHGAFESGFNSAVQAAADVPIDAEPELVREDLPS